MTLVTPSQSSPNDEITSNAINDPINQIAAVLNGQIDDTNISNVSGSKVANESIPKSKLEQPHYAKIFYSTGGAGGGQVIAANAEERLAFNQFEGFGITASNPGTATSGMIIARDGMYLITAQINLSDGTPTNFGLWFGFAGTLGTGRFRHGIRSYGPAVGQTYSGQYALKAGDKVYLDATPGNTAVRVAAPGAATVTDNFALKTFGPYMAVTEIR